MDNVFWMTIGSIIFILIVAAYFVFYMSDMSVVIPNNFNKIKYGPLFIKKVGKHFSLFKLIYVEDSEIFVSADGCTHYFNAQLKIPGLPYKVHVFIVSRYIATNPKISAVIKSILVAGKDFYGKNVDSLDKKEYCEISKVFGRQPSPFSFKRAIWVEKNEHGYLIVVQGKLNGKNIFTNLQKLLIGKRL